MREKNHMKSSPMDAWTKNTQPRIQNIVQISIIADELPKQKHYFYSPFLAINFRKKKDWIQACTVQDFTHELHKMVGWPFADC